jgi:anti-anti-sigma factor
VDGYPDLLSCHVIACGAATRRVAVRGEVDLAGELALRRFLSAQLDDLPVGGALVVDMSEVCFLSAAGLRVLVAVARSARDRRLALRLDPVSELVDRVLEVSGVWRDVERGAPDSDVVVLGSG